MVVTLQGFIVLFSGAMAYVIAPSLARLVGAITGAITGALAAATPEQPPAAAAPVAGAATPQAHSPGAGRHG
jgi:hypothetical protein